MNYVIFDCEVTSHDWLVCFSYNGKEKCIANDNTELIYFFYAHPDDIFVSFNGKHYDNYIIKAISLGYTNKEVKEVNDFIISGHNGWEWDWGYNKGITFNSCDLMDDMQVGLSLKAIECHLGMNIEESNIPFDIPTKLTEEQMKEMIEYCFYDVRATAKLLELRKAYLDNKIAVGKMAGLTAAQSLNLTNAKLTAEYLNATPVHYTDERDYSYPDNIDWKYIPNGVREFYDRIQDKDIPDEELFKSKFEGTLGDCSYTLGFGGIHGDCGNYLKDTTNTNYKIINQDVGSFYPHLVTINGYCSRAISNPKDYEVMLDNRMKAKASGDKVTANALKLVCNTFYGSMGDKYNKLYDPKMMRSVCVSGQLYLLELSNHCYQVGAEIIQINTDGVMMCCEESLIPTIDEICKEWEQRTGFELEKDEISKVVQKDVNNYLEIKEDGSFKCKGGYLVRGISTAGAFNINNNYTIVSKAVIDYFTQGIEPDITINNCDDVFAYQMIAKGGHKYSRVYHIVNDEEVTVQNCNRVYASKDPKFGTLFKVHKENGRPSKIANLPAHCLVDNDNKADISMIDKEFYINKAKQYINDYKGVVTMAETKKKMSIYEKLMLCREEFGKTEKKKSGVNAHAEFTYYELSDIVPIATEVFKKYKVAYIENFTTEKMTCDFVDLEGDEHICFELPFMVNKEPAKYRMNDVQNYGNSFTYYRRYMYMTVLNIVEPDAFDCGSNVVKEEKKEPPKAKAPVTPEKREEVKVKVTSDNASEDHFKVIKKLCKKLPDKYESQVEKIAEESKGFTELSTKRAEEIIYALTELLKEVEG